MKKILYSVGLIVFVAAVALGATGAFFSDSETSTGNTFTAGDIDLQIDNESYVTSTTTGLLVASPSNSWALSNLTNQLFFNFTDVKPGDIGEDTISIHAGSNNSWACMALALTGTPENTLVDPETDVGDVGPANGNNGELQNYLNFSFWKDDGDNVFETGENVITSLSGVASSTFNGSWNPIADAANGPALTGTTTAYIAKAWCFGALTATPIAQDGLGKTGSNGPLTRGTGFSCSVAGNQNAAQTDGIVVDVSFQAVQSRNNGQFLCSSLSPFTGSSTPPVGGPLVGAALASYVAPTCNITATSTIQTAVNTAVAGNTVCIPANTYPENVDVNKDITLASLAGPATTIINGRVRVETAGVTVQGFTIQGAIVPSEGGANGVYVTGGSNNVTISHNIINGATQVDPQERGIHFETGATTGETITNNVIENWGSTGLFFNPTVGPITVTFNDFLTNNVGIGSDGLSNATVNRNVFSTNVTEAFGLGTPGSGNVANENNFVPAGAGNNVNWYTSGSTVDATNNWWDGEADGVRTNDTTNVNVTLPAGSAFLHN